MPSTIYSTLAYFIMGNDQAVVARYKTADGHDERQMA